MSIKSFSHKGTKKLFKIKEKKYLLTQRTQRLIQRTPKIYFFVAFVLAFSFVLFVLNCIWI